MITKYLEKKIREAKYKILRDGTYFGEIPALPGVWASATTLEDCRSELQEVLEDWILLKIRDHERVPGFHVRTDRRELAPSR